ncbi:MAG: 2-C-methyl-D-erythritol 4-phosphate cytidylyltransferase, partial [Clostridia bacterium]|nr:2-C-methyl-D-erythritol 4-phosphate cytidylyltransferase [Clostridia bacterium]
VKRVRGTTIAETIDRNSLVLIQTPQAFKREILVNAHEIAKKNHQLVTDDCALCELIGQPVAVVPGSKLNIKLTTPEDFNLIMLYLSLFEKEDDYV